MEVHTHPHHVTHKKKWGEYLLEFFMLFLAVFLGFVAENIREHLADKHRGKEYVTSFVEDLKKDTAQYKSLLQEYHYSDSVTNNIIDCYNTVKQAPESTACLKEIIPNLLGFSDFVYTDRTIQQLKNAGGLRLIADKDIADSIISYDAFVRRELIHQDALEIYQAKSIDAVKTSINFPSFYNIYSEQFGAISKTQPQVNKEIVDKLFNDLWIFKINLIRQGNQINALKLNAERLIAYLEKKL